MGHGILAKVSNRIPAMKKHTKMSEGWSEEKKKKPRAREIRKQPSQRSHIKQRSFDIAGYRDSRGASSLVAGLLSIPAEYHERSIIICRQEN